MIESGEGNSGIVLVCQYIGECYYYYSGFTVKLPRFTLQAYLFSGYWEDIGTIKSFFDANMGLMDQVGRFHSSLKPWINQSAFPIIFFSPLLFSICFDCILKPPKFQLYDQSKPIFSFPRFLPPSKMEKCQVYDCRVWFI